MACHFFSFLLGGLLLIRDPQSSPSTYNSPKIGLTPPKHPRCHETDFVSLVSLEGAWQSLPSLSFPSSIAFLYDFPSEPFPLSTAARRVY